MSRIKPPCPHCGHTHSADWTVAVGRFDPNGIAGYRAAYDGAPLRLFRWEAELDMCQYKQEEDKV